MKKNWIWIVFATLAIIAIVLFIFIADTDRKAAFACEKELLETAKELAEANRQKNEAEFALEECQKELAKCEEKQKTPPDTVVTTTPPPVPPTPPVPPVDPASAVSNAELQRQITNLKRQVERRPVTKPEKQEILVTVVHENAPAAQGGQVAPSVEVATEPIQVQRVSANMQLPSYFYEDEKGVKWTIRLGGNEGRHLTHLAIADGIFGEQNGLSGYNWIETEPVTEIKGGRERGVVKGTGTFFILKSFVDKYMIQSDRGIVEIKAPATAWQPKRMTIERHDGFEYYVYKAIK